MANKETAYMSIEELRDKYKVSDAMFEGVKAAKKWKSGRQVEEDEFTKAVEDFKTAPIDVEKRRRRDNVRRCKCNRRRREPWT